MLTTCWDWQSLGASVTSVNAEPSSSLLLQSSFGGAGGIALYRRGKDAGATTRRKDGLNEVTSEAKSGAVAECITGGAKCSTLSTAYCLLGLVVLLYEEPIPDIFGHGASAMCRMFDINPTRSLRDFVPIEQKCDLTRHQKVELSVVCTEDTDEGGGAGAATRSGPVSSTRSATASSTTRVVRLPVLRLVTLEGYGKTMLAKSLDRIFRTPTTVCASGRTISLKPRCDVNVSIDCEMRAARRQ